MLPASAGDPERFPREVRIKVGLKDAGGHREVEHSEDVMQTRDVAKAWRLGIKSPFGEQRVVQCSWCVIHSTLFSFS